MCTHTPVKYLNNRLEADPSKTKWLLKPVSGFKSMKTTYATIKGFEAIRMLFRKGQMRVWQLLPDIKGEVHLVESSLELTAKRLRGNLQQSRRLYRPD